MDQASSLSNLTFHAGIWVPANASVITPRGRCEDALQRKRAEKDIEWGMSAMQHGLNPFTYDLVGRSGRTPLMTTRAMTSRYSRDDFYRSVPTVRGYHPTVGILSDSVLEAAYEEMMRSTAPIVTLAAHPPRTPERRRPKMQASSQAITDLFANHAANSTQGRSLVLDALSPRRAVGGTPCGDGAPSTARSSNSRVPAGPWAPGGAGFVEGEGARPGHNADVSRAARSAPQTRAGPEPTTGLGASGARVLALLPKAHGDCVQRIVPSARPHTHESGPAQLPSRLSSGPPAIGVGLPGAGPGPAESAATPRTPAHWRLGTPPGDDGPFARAGLPRSDGACGGRAQPAGAQLPAAGELHAGAAFTPGSSRYGGWTPRPVSGWTPTPRPVSKGTMPGPWDSSATFSSSSPPPPSLPY